MKANVFSFSHTGGREENEDCAGIEHYGDNIVAVVADGLGGQGDGKAASHLVYDGLITCGSQGYFPDAATVEDAFFQTNRNLIASQKNAHHMKSTAVYLCVHKEQAIWAHIGDSRLYHVYNEKLCDYTLDHSASQLAVYLGLLERKNIPKDPGQSRLFRAMGTEDDKPDIHVPIHLEKGHHGFLLCTDGLWEYIDDETIAREFAIAESAKELCTTLISIKERTSPSDCDNFSAAVVLVEV